MRSPWISGRQDLPWVSVLLCWDGSTAGKELGKCRENALNSTDHQVPHQSPAGEFPAPQLGQAGSAWPAKSLQLHLVRLWDRGWNTHPAAGEGTELLPPSGDGNPTWAPQERGGCSSRQPEPAESQEKSLCCLHTSKSTVAAAGRRVLLLGNRENWGIDTYQVLRKIAELFSVLDSRAINSTGSGAGWGILNPWYPATWQEMRVDPLECTACRGKGQCHSKSLFNTEKALLSGVLSATLREDGNRF